MNRCTWCGTGMPREGMVCDKCREAADAAREWLSPRALAGDQTDPVVAFIKDEETGAWAPPKPQDKSLIWEDCPACSLKHLGAAYAAVTSPDCGTLYATQAEVLVARSLIAIRECESGYSGNAALAAGCLALAETLYCGAPDERKCWRDARLLLQSGKRREAEELILPPTLAALAGGHIAEALRELPALADRTCLGSLFTGGDFEPDTAGGLRDWLRESIGWICKTYELEVKE